MPKFKTDVDIQKQKEYFEKRGIVFLEDEIEELYINIWNFARSPSGFGVEIKDNRVELMCDRYGLDLLDTLEIIEKIERGSSSE